MSNLLITFMVSISWRTWRYLPVGALIHGGLMLLTWGDVRRIDKVKRYLKYPAHLPAHGRRRVVKKGRYVS